MFVFSGGDSGIASDPNSIKVGGDVNMSLDINEAIKEDAELQEEAWDILHVNVILIVVSPSLKHGPSGVNTRLKYTRIF